MAYFLSPRSNCRSLPATRPALTWYVPFCTACLTESTLAASTTGAFATASSIFCSERAESVSVTVSPVCAAGAGVADEFVCDLSATTPLLFVPLMGASGSLAVYPLILLDTCISPRARNLPITYVIVRVWMNFNDYARVPTPDSLIDCDRVH